MKILDSQWEIFVFLCELHWCSKFSRIPLEFVGNVRNIYLKFFNILWRISSDNGNSRFISANLLLGVSQKFRHVMNFPHTFRCNIFMFFLINTTPMNRWPVLSRLVCLSVCYIRIFKVFKFFLIRITQIFYLKILQLLF